MIVVAASRRASRTTTPTVRPLFLGRLEIAMPELRGTRFGPYEIAALIGVGGMGEVYRATDTNLKRDVALKVLPESLVTDANRLARLQREAELLASLNHTNVAQIYGLERSEGRTALVMELIDGPTLAERIAQGALPANEALNVALQIVSALEAAHERGIVHRDLKPANIKLKADGAVKVLDFGIAKALEARAINGPQPAALTSPSMTEAGVVLGTAAYMSPEQARGKPVDRRTDVWAFGCVLYEMLTGKAAFEGDDMTTTLARVLEREPDMRQLPSGLPATVRGTLELCLQKDPKKRVRDIGDVRLALEGELGHGSPSSARPLWRRALPIAVAVAVGAVFAGALVAILVRAPNPIAERQSALPVTRFVITPQASAPLANLGGYDVMISPDGQRIVYFGRNPDNNNIALYVREIDGLEARVVPGTELANVAGGFGGNMNPFFSADSRSIGFLSPDRGVTRVSVDGGPPIKMVDAPSPGFLGATWTADDTIVYSAGRSLHRASAGGGATPELLMEGMPNAFLASPVVLPGGRAVMYGFIEGAAERVAVFDLDAREQKIIIENGQNAFYSETGHVVFARGTTIMAAPFDASELAVAGEPVAMIENVRHPGTLTAADFALSASGTLVYVPASGDQTVRAAVVWVDRAGRVQGRAIGELLDNPRDPALSPDGTRLALTTGPASQGDLWSYDLRGRPPIRLAVVDEDRGAVWSPDSRQVAFTVVGGSTGAAPNLHTVLADGSMLTPRPLRAEGAGGFARAWSAAGELFLIVPPAQGGLQASNIAVVAVTGEGSPQEIVATEYQETDPALSPDGRWLAYASSRTGRIEVWVQGYPEGVAVRVSRDGGYEPRWSGDGAELYYLQGDAVMAVAVEAAGELSFSAPEKLFSGPYVMNQGPVFQSYDVARDGRFLMIELPGGAAANAASQGIVVVQNWTQELERRVPGR
jgi:eukaryotic-like serine/threonine-protein kinase